MEAEPERQLACPPATWQEHWSGHRQLLRLCHSDEHCAIYTDPDVRRAEVRWLPRCLRGPDADDVPALVDALVLSLHTGLNSDPVVRSAMAHLNLVMIHPFRDARRRAPLAGFEPACPSHASPDGRAPCR